MENGGSGTSAPCGACKFLRRKCAAECVFAPYFRTEVGPARFAAVHKVFGASNASKLLQQLPFTHRYAAVHTIAYEAQARIRDPVRGCVAHILSLQQQVFQLQAELLEMRAKVAAHQWPSSTAVAAEIPPPQFPTRQDRLYSDYSSSIEGFSGMQSEIRDDEEEVFLLRNERKRRRASHNHLNELQQMALMMMKNAN